ncbi:MAG: hypothetical protein DRG24_09215 [Epsilonproteobacteria bacterium]|nr:MAG: hypothetical protein DRG24_09215 [Campylobacterota bacterium]
MRFLLLFLVLQNFLFASSIVLEQKQRSINVVPFSQYMIDEDGAVTSKNILEYHSEFSDASTVIYSFGFLNQPLWIRFSIDASEVSVPWILNIDNPQIDYYELYRLENSKLVSVGVGGDRVCVENSSYQCRTYWQDIGDSSKIEDYYLLIKTEGSLQVPLQVKQLSHAYNTEQLSMLIYGLYYGILFILLIYNFVLYVMLRDVTFMNYLLFLSSYMIWQLSFDGIGLEWLWPNTPWMANDGLSLFIFLSSAMAFRFSRHFLMLKKYNKLLYKLSIYAEVASYIGVILALLLSFTLSIKLAAFWVTVVPIVLIYMGYKVWPLYQPARFYLIGWGFFLLATVLVGLDKQGLIPSYAFIVHQQQIGSVLEMLFLSLALADRIGLMKRDHLKELKRSMTILQKKIDKKVEEARQKDKILIQQSRQAAMGEMIENIAHQWRQPLNQLSLIQNNIFIEYAFGKLDEKSMAGYQDQSEKLMHYMTETIDDFRNFFEPDREKTHFDICHAIHKTEELVASTLKQHVIDVKFSCSEKLLAYGHENEFSQVILNIFNNAKDILVERKVQHPHIFIRINRNMNDLVIEICDNGKGVDGTIVDKIFDPYFTTKFKSQGTGIGLYMSKMIIENSMEGSLRVRNEDEGACFIITLPVKELKGKINV